MNKKIVALFRKDSQRFLAWSSVALLAIVTLLVSLSTSTFSGSNSLALVALYDRVASGPEPEFVVPGRARYIKATPTEFLAESFTLELFPGETFTFVRDRIAQYPKGGTAWVGHILNEPQSVAIFGAKGKSIHGSISRDGKAYEIIAVRGDVHKVREIDVSKLPPELENASEEDATTAGGVATASAGTAPAEVGTPTIDVMVVYTPSAASYAGGQTGIESMIIGAVELANLDYRNSLLNMQVRLVHMEQVSYTESGDMVATLADLLGTADGKMDSVHATRNMYGADLVAIVSRDTNACGYGYNTTLSGSPERAFVAVAPNCLNPNNSLAHEWGHNMGNKHNREQDTTGGVYPYSFGYCNSGKFRDVMSYSCAGEPRLNYFSNPNVLYNGMPFGTPDLADTVRSMTQMAPIIAAYRPSAATNPPASPSNLVGTPTAATKVTLTWSDNSDNEAGFRVERSVNSGTTWTVLTTTTANTASYADTSVAQLSTYSYRVAAINGAGASAYTNTVSVTTPEVDSIAPTAPTNVTGTATSGSRIELTWSASTDNVGVSGYVVYRGGTQVATVSETSYSDTGLQSATAYTYTVKALDATGNSSASSASITVSTLTAPLAITSSGVSTKLTTSATITWMTNVQSSGTVYYGTSKTALTKSVTDGVVGMSHAAAITGLTKNTTYYYKVTATTADGQTVDSVIGTFKTRPK